MSSGRRGDGHHDRDFDRDRGQARSGRRRRRRGGRGDDARGVARVPAGPVPPEPDDSADKAGPNPLGLIPGPDETTLLPRVPSASFPSLPSEELPSTRRRRAVKRHRDADPPGSRRMRTTVRSFAEVALTFGAVLLLFLGWQYWYNNAEVSGHQEALNDQVDDEWEDGEPESDPLPGDAVARLYMPQIRSDPWVVVEGTTLSDIEFAPGRYDTGAMPGETGNFAMAGHNVPAIFRHIDELDPGDKIVVETRSHFHIYEISGHEIVKPTAVEVVAPVPNEPEVEPGDDDRYLTMTTCYPWWDNYERYVVYAELTGTEDRGDELPAEARG